MKKTNFILAIALCAFIGMNIAQAQIKVANGGNVGIGIGNDNPITKLHVQGSVYLPDGGSYWIGQTSDRGKRLRMHLNGNAYIDYCPTLSFRTSISSSSSTLRTALVLDSLGNALFTGNVGIGLGSTAPTYKLDVNGSTRFTGFITEYSCMTWAGPPYDTWCKSMLYSKNQYGSGIGTYNYPVSAIEVNWINALEIHIPSDRKAKTNILPLSAEKTKNKLDQVNVYTYDLNPTYFDYVKSDIAKAEIISQGKNQAGVMAQEIKDLFPELVKYDSLGDRYSVNYIGFIPHLIQAVKSLHQENETLKAQILSIQQNCCPAGKSIVTKSMQEANATEETIVLSARLDQNKPNPFKEGTSISYYIPEKAQKVGIYIYDLTGKQIKQIPIIGKGEGSISIKGSELTAGMYLYALIIDSMPIDTKRMILTE